MRTGLLTVIALLLSLWAPEGIARGPKGHRPAWDRDVGLRQRSHPTRSQRKRFSFGKERQVDLHAGEVVKLIESFKRSPLARVTCIGHGAFSTPAFPSGNPIYRIDVPATSGRSKGKKGKGRPLKVLVSAWIHGDEVVGTAAALKLVDRAVRDKGFRNRFDLSVVVKVDPFETRNRPDGINVNRRFRAGKWTAETLAIKRSVQGESFDLFADLHGAHRDGFFLIRGKKDGNISRRILSCMDSCTLLDAEPGPDPKVGPYHMHALGGAFSKTKGTFKGFMAGQGVPYSYTLEAPMTLPADRQVSGLFKMLRSTLNNVARYGKF